MPKVVPDSLPRLLAEHGVTVTGASTAFYQMLVAAQFDAKTTEPLIPTLRMLIGGAPPARPRCTGRYVSICAFRWYTRMA